MILNKSEQRIRKKYEDLGYDVIHKGVPDFILLKDGEIEFVEVKYGKDALRDSQKRAFELLRKHRQAVRVERVPKIKKSALLERWNNDHSATQTLSTSQQAIPDQAHSNHSKLVHASPDPIRSILLSPYHPHSVRPMLDHSKPGQSTSLWRR